MTAVDISRNRLKRLEANMARLGLSVTTVAADARAFEPQEPFDVILLDAPPAARRARSGGIPMCPGSSKLTTLKKLSEIQRDLLDRTVSWVKPGGLIVYCTCSLEPQEGEAQAAAFVERQSGKVGLVPIDPKEIGGLGDCVTKEGYLRCLPCHKAGTAAESTGMDGFSQPGSVGFNAE
ncbi:hypothetical protein QW131_23050 [Roseibium salinum]|nr:hypothetical protein [Roseibium salinum]